MSKDPNLKTPSGAPLADKQRRFVEEFLVDLNATAAYKRAGYGAAGNAAEAAASRLLSNVKVAEAIAAAMTERSKRTQIDADAVLTRWWWLATADPNELVEVRRTCCRYCYGLDHGYHRTVSEHNSDYRAWQREQAKLKVKDRETFDEQGGVGYDGCKPAHPHCPECFGEGRITVLFKDTSNLSPAGRELYAGAKVTKDGGIEIRMQSREKALEMVARHLGMFAERIEHTGKDGGPIKTQNTNLQAIADSKVVQDTLELFKKRYG